MTADDRLALLVAVQTAAGQGFAPEARIRGALGHRLAGPRLRAALGVLHSEGLVIPALRRGWAVTADGWHEIVRPSSRDLRSVTV